MPQLRIHRAGRHGSRGQGLVEFALVLPVLLLVLLFAIDFGRLFNAAVTLNNAARVGANYAATHPYAWDAIPSSTDVEQKADYRGEINREFAGTACLLLNGRGEPDLGPPDPSFPDDSLAFGDSAKASLTCLFTPITPLIGLVVGNAVPISASAVFPIRTGVPGEAPPLPPCFNQTTVPDIEGAKIADANILLAAANLVGLGSPTWPDPPNNRVHNQNPVYSACAPIGSTVTYEYKP